MERPLIVPQFLLDHALISGQGCSYRIACTQPRRISAITIAERVAEERNEKCGNSVGYQIRLEKKLPRDYASIVFCTTGIILQKLDGDPLLNEYSHIIIDEIHERDINCDLLLTVLKEKVIPYRKDLKVILMSATLNAQIFSKYFDNCEILHIPGFCFHVKQFFLEDILEELQFFNFDIPTAKKEKKLGRLGNDLQEKMFEYIKLNRNKYSPKVFQALQNPRSELINVELITKLVWHIYDTQPQGAILIFLPGAKMITSLHNMLDCESNRTRRCLLIYPLHSQMPTAYQKEIFQIPPFGFRKVIISTNIAETSITVEDVKYVIDCGKCKLKTFDIDTKLESLSDHWVSIANMKQRKGRAGRTSEGVSYHLFSRPRLSTFIDYQLPEMLRTRIEEVILRIKLLQLGDISDFLKNVLDPPDEKVVKFSIELLQRLNALDAAQNLTPLGYHLAQLPMDPQIGKMILMASLFSCVEPIFSIAASLAYKDAFVYPIGKEQQVNNRKIELSNNTRSDHLMLSEVMSGFEDAQMSNQVSSYCWKNFVNAPTLHLLQDMKKEFAVHLFDKHFLYSKDVQEPISNMHSHNVKLLRAIVCAGLYPNVAYARVGKQRNKKPARIKFFSMEGGIPKYVEFHPGSVNAMEKYFDSHYFVFHKKMKTSKVYLYDTTMVDPLALIFFGDNIVKGIEDDIEFISVDGMQFRCKNEIADIILQLKKYLDDILLFKVSNARYVDWKNDCDTEVKILTMISELIGGENSYDSDDDSE